MMKNIVFGYEINGRSSVWLRNGDSLSVSLRNGESLSVWLQIDESLSVWS